MHFCIADQIANVVESYKRKDHLFVETKAFTEVEDIINDRYWALITGKPGDGKSSMAAHLMLKYKEKGFEPVILTNAHDWKKMVKGKSDDNKTDNQFVMIDDMFGSMSVDDKKVNEWVSMMEVMQRVIKERTGSLVVVCTSRAHVFYDIKAKFEKFSCFQSASCVDMTQIMHVLSYGEKMRIWLKYTKENNITSSAPQCIYNTVISPHGFPHCVELFCSNLFLRQQGVAFFENPMQFICKEIQNFKENDKIKYCLLLLILFNGNKLEEGVLQQICLSDPPKEVIKIFKAAGLSSDYAQSELKKALGSLRNTYVYEDVDNSYRFSHESIRENVAFMYIKDNPLHAIEEIDINYLVDHTRCYGHKSDRQENIFVLPSFSTNALVERMVKEIERGQKALVCQHQAWDDHVFIGKFVDYVLRRFTENKRCADSIHNLLFTRQNPVRMSWSLSYVEFNLFEMLIYSKHITAVTHILQNKKIKTLLQLQESIQVQERIQSMSYAVICACFCMPDSHIISSLLQAGADINIELSRQDVIRYAKLNEHRYRLQTVSEIYNPLLCAVVTANTSLVMLLMDKGGSVFIGEDPVALIAAVELNLPDVLKIILGKTARSRALLYLKARDMNGCTCLTRLLGSVEVKYMSALHACNIGGGLIYEEFALQTGSYFWNDVDTFEFQQAVAVAVRYSVGDMDCLRIVKELTNKALDVLQTVLSAGADPNILDISGKSPLHHYVQSPLADIFICPAIKMLIDNGAKVNDDDFEGMTPLMACSQFGCKSKRLNILIAAGANIREVDDFGRDAVEYGKMAFCRMLYMHRKDEL